MYNNLYKWYCDNAYNTYHLQNSKEYKQILSLTQFLDIHYNNLKIGQRIWHIKNKNFNTRLCVICNKPSKFVRGERGYLPTCGCDYCKKECIKISNGKIKILKELNNVNKNDVMLLTHFLPKDVGYTQRIWHIKNEFYEIPKCVVCGVITKWDVKHNRYISTCSKKCGHEYRYSEKERCRRDIIKLETNIQKYGVSNYSKSKEYRDCIIKELNKKFLIYGFSNKGYIPYEIKEKSYTMHCSNCGNDFDISNKTLYYRLKHNIGLCVACNPINKFYSNQEKQLSDYIKSIYNGEINENVRKKELIFPYEIDIYLPELKIAIEFNGDYFHMNPKFYGKNDYNFLIKKTAEQIWEKDKLKSLMCKEKRIEFITIWEKDWIERQTTIKRYLNNKINTNKILK